MASSLSVGGEASVGVSGGFWGVTASAEVGASYQDTSETETSMSNEFGYEIS
jgi:hypothetical protein